MFKSRSAKKELLDQDVIPEQDLFQNLQELDFINQWLGGYNVSFSALKRVIGKSRKIRIVDIGCGGGDTLKRIRNWNRRQGYDLELTGIDIKPVCIQYAKSNLNDPTIRLICDDYRNAFSHIDKADVIHASLFCHHLSETELIELIRFSVENGVILIINDLERHPLAYYSIKCLTAIFSKSYLVKNDAPLSVLRGFRRKEWIAIIQKAGAVHFSVRNKWAFRHEVLIHANKI